MKTHGLVQLPQKQCLRQRFLFREFFGLGGEERVSLREVGQRRETEIRFTLIPWQKLWRKIYTTKSILFWCKGAVLSFYILCQWVIPEVCSAWGWGAAWFPVELSDKMAARWQERLLEKGIWLGPIGIHSIIGLETKCYMSASVTDWCTDAEVVPKLGIDGNPLALWFRA